MTLTIFQILIKWSCYYKVQRTQIHKYLATLVIPLRKKIGMAFQNERVETKKKSLTPGRSTFNTTTEVIFHLFDTVSLNLTTVPLSS